MKISLDWLREYVQLDEPVQSVADCLVNMGIEVDQIHIPLDNIIVAMVLTITPVPESNKGIQIVTLDVGDGFTITVLSGAPNLVRDTLVAYAPAGTLLPGWEEPLVVRSMFGGKYESAGMICSERELQLGDDHTGIMHLPSGKPGEKVAEVLGLSTVLEIEPTTNRPDTMCHVGIARELTVGLNQELQSPVRKIDLSDNGKNPVEELVDVSVETEGCRRFTAKVIQNVKVDSSPPWLQARLLSIGQRPINNVVDVTNYVLWELGQPLHAFDYGRFLEIGGSSTAKVRIKDGHNEKLLCLDGQEYQLNKRDMVVYSGDEPVSIAGIIGGQSTAVQADTTTVLLEAGAWKATRIRKSTKGLNFRTDAASLFEKELSDLLPIVGLQRAAGLIAELGEGELVEGAIDEHPYPFPPIEAIKLSIDYVQAILGYKVEVDEAVRILRALEFKVSQHGKDLKVMPPYFRLDVSIPIDVVEEIGRCLGYDRLPATLPGRRMPSKTLAVPRPTEDRVREFCIGNGFDEAITYSFSSPKLVELSSSWNNTPTPLRIINPLREEWSVLRTSVLPGLCEAIAHNVNHGQSEVALFELGAVFWEGRREGEAWGARENGVHSQLPALPAEPTMLGLVAHLENDNTGSISRNLRHFQSLLFGINQRLFQRDLVFDQVDLPGFRPGVSVQLMLEGLKVGVLGLLNTKLTRQFDFRGFIAAAEINLSELKAHGSQNWLPKYLTPSKFPAITQDLAVVVPSKLKAGVALEVITNVGGKVLESAELYDEYCDSKLGDGRKSWTFRLTYRADDKTLTGIEVQQLQDKIVMALAEECQASLRQ